VGGFVAGSNAVDEEDYDEVLGEAGEHFDGLVCKCVYVCVYVYNEDEDCLWLKCGWVDVLLRLRFASKKRTLYKPTTLRM
jgi:hypothetical protein